MPEIRAKAEDTAKDNIVAGIRLTHPDRLLWEGQGLTKRDLAAWYEAAGDRILPHLRNRPLTLLRCPSGTGGRCFVQKHGWPGLSDAVRRVRLKSEEKQREQDEWLAVDDTAGLIALVQMGVLELHPWGATLDDPDRPDRLILDLDPEEGVAWNAVVEGAMAIRDRLDALGLQSFVKATGGKGLHVVAPLEPSAGWDEVRDFAHGLASGLAEERPGRYTANPLKEARKGRIYIDYLRNGRGASAVAAWSVRARPGAPVAFPLDWGDLEGLEGAPAVPAGDPALLRSRDPWQGFFELRQRLPGASRTGAGQAA